MDGRSGNILITCRNIGSECKHRSDCNSDKITLLQKYSSSGVPIAYGYYNADFRVYYGLLLSAV